MDSSGVGKSSRRKSALLVDVGGTLLETSKPVVDTYLSFAEKHGVDVTPVAVKQGFKTAFSSPWPHALRYEGDGRVFWKYAVETATGSANEALFEDLYQHYADPEAWQVATGAVSALQKLRNSGVRLAVVSNFDTRLRPLLQSLNVDILFDAIVVSAEVGKEKPDREIFHIALQELQVDDPADALHVGDDRINDKFGAEAAGLDAILWKEDLHNFEELAQLILRTRNEAA
ncbi:hypothetical protein CYMTET_39703 [Cymbomonas tetramitiformis]|uniref:Haloacid dehalogenase-like hydrolase domain-containing protein 3 n=1 Tax=Cymbomonas tetramitiformis TaxID=36881 RepID=A0AAE0F3Z5_9CHLO|nr:hypothetical protein CYMTET_39703 [Cymbomonas tetramitiformis]